MAQDHLFAEILNSFAHLEQWIPGCGTWPVDLLIGKLPQADPANVYRLADSWTALANRLNGYYNDVSSLGTPIMRTWQGDGAALDFTEAWGQHLQDIGNVMQSVDAMQQMAQGYGLQLETEEFFIACMLIQLLIEAITAIISAFFTGGISLGGLGVALAAARIGIKEAFEKCIEAILHLGEMLATGELRRIIAETSLKDLAALAGRELVDHGGQLLNYGRDAIVHGLGPRNILARAAADDAAKQFEKDVVKSFLRKELEDQLAHVSTDLAAKEATKILDTAVEDITRRVAADVQEQLLAKFTGKTLEDVAGKELANLGERLGADELAAQTQSMVSKFVADQVAQRTMVSTASKYVGRLALHGALFMGKINLGAQVFELVTGERSSIDFGELGITLAQGGLMGGLMFGHGLLGSMGTGGLAGTAVAAAMDGGQALYGAVTGQKVDIDWSGDLWKGARDGVRMGLVFSAPGVLSGLMPRTMPEGFPGHEVFSLDDPRLGANVFTFNRQTGELGFVSEFGGAGYRLADGSFVRLDGQGDLISSHRAMDFVEVDPPPGSGSTSRPVALLERGTEPPTLRPGVETPGRPPEGPLSGDRPTPPGGDRPTPPGGDRTTPGGARPPETPNGDRPPETTNGDRPPETPTGDRPPETTNGDRPPETAGGQRPETPTVEPPGATSGAGPEPPHQGAPPRPEIPAEQVPIRQADPPAVTTANGSHAQAIQAGLHDPKAPEALRAELATHLGTATTGESVPLTHIEQTVQHLSLAGREATLGSHPDIPEPGGPGGPGGPHEPTNWTSAAAGGKEVSETLPAQLFHDVLQTRVPGGLAHADPEIVHARTEELAKQLLATDPEQVSSVDTARRLREYAVTELSRTDTTGRSGIDPTKLDRYVDETIAAARVEETSGLRAPEAEPTTSEPPVAGPRPGEPPGGPRPGEPHSSEPPGGPPRPPVPEHPAEQPSTHPAPTHPQQHDPTATTHVPPDQPQHLLLHNGHPPDWGQLIRHEQTSHQHPDFDRKFMELREATPGGEKHWFLVTEHVTHYWAEADYGRLPIEELEGGATGPVAQAAAHHAAQDLANREYTRLVDVTNEWLNGKGSIEDVASVGGMSAAVVLHDGRIVAATSFRERTIQTRVDTDLTNHDWQQLKRPERQTLAEGYAGSRQTALAAEAETALHPLVREALGDVPKVLRSATHGRCAEPLVISRIARIVEADLRQELGGEPPDFQDRVAQRLHDIIRDAPIASHRNDGTPIDRSEQLPCSTDDQLISRFQMHSDYIDRALSDALVDPEHRLIVLAKPGDPLYDYSTRLPETPPGHVTVVVHGSVEHGEISATLGDVQGGGIELARVLQHVIAQHPELAGKSLALVACEADATGVTRGMQTSLIREVSVRLDQRVVGSPHVLLVSEHGDIEMAAKDPNGPIVVNRERLALRPTTWHEATPTYDRHGQINGAETHVLPAERWPFPGHGPHQLGHQVLAGDREPGLSQHAPFRHSEAYADPEYRDAATAYEQAVGAYYFNDPGTIQAVRDAVGQLRHVLTELAIARHPELTETEARTLADRAFFRDDAPDSAGQVGRGVSLDELIAHGNVRELMTSFYNAAYFDRANPDNLAHALRDLIDGKSWEVASHAGVNLHELRRVEHVLDRSVLRWIGERFDAERFASDNPFGMGDIALLSKHQIRDGLEIIRSQAGRDYRTEEEQRALGLIHTAGDYERMGAPLGRFERGYLENMEGGPLDDDAELRWREGETVYETSGAWAESASEKGLVPVAGVSGTTARMLTAAKLIGLDEATTKSFLDGLMGWMLPGRDHSVYEILRGGEFAEVVSPEFRNQQFDPTYTYRHLPGIDPATVRAIAPEGLPHEKVYFDQATGTPGFAETRPEVLEVARKLWPQLASGHVHDPNLEHWLTSNGIDPHNPAEVTAFAHQLSEAHVIALTVYTQHAHYLINNVVRTELWTHNEPVVRGIFNKRVDQLLHNYLDEVARSQAVEPLPVELHGVVHTGDDASSPLHPLAQRYVDTARALHDAQQRLAAGDRSAAAAVKAARQALKVVDGQLTDAVDLVRDRLYREVRWHADMAYDALLRLPTVGSPNAPVIAFRGDKVVLPYTPLYGTPLLPDASNRVFLSLSRSPDTAAEFLQINPGTGHKMLVVYKLTGGYARDVSVFSSYPEEQELLFPPGSLMTRVDDPTLVAQVRQYLGVRLPNDCEIIVMAERAR